MIWTICFLIKESDGKKKVCLGMKKAGHGAGKWNGTGGKPKAEDTGNLENTARREGEEEFDVIMEDLEKVAELEFRELTSNSIHTATAFICRKWKGEPKELEEMRPEWFDINNIPYDQMWSADQVWIPLVLTGQKIKAVFEYSEGDNLANYNILPL